MTHVTSRQILAQTARLIRSSPFLPLLALVLLAGLATMMDLASEGRGGGEIILSAAGFIAQFAITKMLVERRNLVSASGYRSRGVPVVFGICFLSNLGILAGLVLLVVPGVILAVRWFSSVPIVLSEDIGVIEGLRESWERSKGSGWAIFVTMLIIYAPLFLTMTAAAALQESFPTASGLTTVVANVALYAALIGGWYAAVAFYEIRRPASPMLEDVFA